jgi:hydrogenase 3 maturation protease
MSGTIVLGIGNRLGGDDAAGTCVVDILNQGKNKTGALLDTEIVAIDVGTAPESYTSIIRRHQPDLLILIDAADMGLNPGVMRAITPERISILSFSTHNITLSTFIAYVEEFCGEILLIGVQPEQTDMGNGLSKAVRKSMKKLAETILEGRTAEIPLLR